MLLEVKKKLGVCIGGFTLIEIIVVMALVALLSVMSIGGYLQYRRSTILNLSGDSIVSQIYSQKNKAGLGAYKGQRDDEIRNELSGNLVGDKTNSNIFESKCFTVLFEKDSDGGISVYSVQRKFDGQKKWSGDSWIYVGCEDNADDQKVLFELDSLVKIDDISIGNFSDKNVTGKSVVFPFEVRFLPPDGKVEIVEAVGQAMVPDINESIKIDISYGDNNPDYQKSIFFKL